MAAMLVDTHAHLYWESYKDDLDQIVQHALNNQVSEIINVGVDANLSEVAAKLKSPNPKVKFYSSVGIHPEEALQLSPLAQDRSLAVLEQIYRKNPEKVVAVGECGLDFLDASPEVKKLQRQLLAAQINLAKKLNLPLVIHCRDDRSQNPQNGQCWDEILQMTQGWRGVYHCYSGLAQHTQHIIQSTDFFISFAANITYPKNGYLQAAAKITPLEKILLETDSPFLAPQSKRGQRNEPANVLEVARAIAQLKGISLPKVIHQTTLNAHKIYGL